MLLHFYIIIPSYYYTIILLNYHATILTSGRHGAVDREFVYIDFFVLRLSRFSFFLLAHTLTPSAFFFVPSSFFFLPSFSFFLHSSFFSLLSSFFFLLSSLGHLGSRFRRQLPALPALPDRSPDARLKPYFSCAWTPQKTIVFDM